MILNIDKTLVPIKGREGTFYKYIDSDAFYEKYINAFTFNDVTAFTGLYRHVSCWMSPYFGRRAEDIIDETQFLIFKGAHKEYTIAVPLVQNSFRCCFTYNDGIKVIAQSGDTAVKTCEALVFYVISGENPYDMMTLAARDISGYLKSFRLMCEKQEPDWVNYLGWCTYNAMYQNVSDAKIMQAAEKFKSKGIMPGFILLDAGWQKNNNATGHLENMQPDSEKFPGGLENTISDLKENYSVKYFMIWQAFSGSFRGIDSTGFKKYYPENAVVKVAERFQPKSANEKDIATVGKGFYSQKSYKEGINIPTPGFFEFYNDYHDSMRRLNVDGVKIDAMAWVESLGEGRGGRVEMTKRMLHAAEASAGIHFGGNLLCCSSCSNDFLFNVLNSTVTRTSCDYFPKKPESHSKHILTNAHTSFFMSHFILPDWDMFQSGNTGGEYHAAARAISGGPVYFTDVIGEEDEEILKKLCTSKGYVPRPIVYGMVSERSMFTDVENERKAINIFNKNLNGGIVASFNCCYSAEENIIVESIVSSADINGLEGEKFAVFSFTDKKAIILNEGDEIYKSLAPLEFEIYTFVPVKDGIAVIGMIDKYNPGGWVEFADSKKIFVIDGGRLGIWCKIAPVKVLVNSRESLYEYQDDGLCVITIEYEGRSCIEIYYG